MSLLNSKMNEYIENVFNSLIIKGNKAVEEKDWNSALKIFHEALGIAEKKNLEQWIRWLKHNIIEVNIKIKENDVKLKELEGDFDRLIEKGEEARDYKQWGVALWFFQRAFLIAENNNYPKWIEWIKYQINNVHELIKFNDFLQKGVEARKGKHWRISLFVFKEALKIAEENEYDEWIYWLHAQINTIQRELDYAKVHKHTLKTSSVPKRAISDAVDTQVIFSFTDDLKSTLPEAPTYQSLTNTPFQTVAPKRLKTIKSKTESRHPNFLITPKSNQSRTKGIMDAIIYKRVEALLQEANFAKNHLKWGRAMRLFKEALGLFNNDHNNLIFKGVLTEFREFKIEHFLNDGNHALKEGNLLKAKNAFNNAQYISKNFGIGKWDTEIAIKIRNVREQLYSRSKKKY